MAEREAGRGGGRRMAIPGGVAIVAALIVVAGFAMRMAGTFLSRAELRFAGVALIAVGVGVAVLGWLADKLIHARRRS